MNFNTNLDSYYKWKTKYYYSLIIHGNYFLTESES